MSQKGSKPLNVKEIKNKFNGTSDINSGEHFPELLVYKIKVHIMVPFTLTKKSSHV